MATRQIPTLPPNAGLLDSDLFLTRQGATDKRLSGALLKQALSVAGVTTFDNVASSLIATTVQEAIDEVVVDYKAADLANDTAINTTFNGTASSLSATNVQAAIDEVVVDYKANDTALNTSFSPLLSALSATNVQNAIDEVSRNLELLEAEDIPFNNGIPGLAGGGQGNVQGAINAMVSEYRAGDSAINTTFNGTASSLSATNVQAAIDEVVVDSKVIDFSTVPRQYFKFSASGGFSYRFYSESGGGSVITSVNGNTTRLTSPVGKFNVRWSFVSCRILSVQGVTVNYENETSTSIDMTFIDTAGIGVKPSDVTLITFGEA